MTTAEMLMDKFPITDFPKETTLSHIEIKPNGLNYHFISHIDESECCVEITPHGRSYSFLAHWHAIHVKACHDYVLIILFRDGRMAYLDMKYWVSCHKRYSGKYTHLKDIKLFKQVFVESNGWLRWPCLARLNPRYIYSKLTPDNNYIDTADCW